ncbi:MAG: NifU family protein [Alloacidobacterium sp.]
MASEQEFQEKIRQLGTLVGELNDAPEGSSKVAAREMVQLLMEVHGAGLERIMELVFELGEHGEAVINRIGQDPIARNLLLLYSLHPDDLETRLLKALDEAKTRLRKYNTHVEVVSIQDGAVQLRLVTSGHACGSTTKTLQSIVEESIYELAPDLTSLLILGSADEGASGFVPLENLLKHSFAAPVLAVRGAEVDGAG